MMLLKAALGRQTKFQKRYCARACHMGLIVAVLTPAIYTHREYQTIMSVYITFYMKSFQIYGAHPYISLSVHAKFESQSESCKFTNIYAFSFEVILECNVELFQRNKKENFGARQQDKVLILRLHVSLDKYAICL
jgi:hypothetical protein